MIFPSRRQLRAHVNEVLGGLAGAIDNLAELLDSGKAVMPVLPDVFEVPEHLLQRPTPLEPVSLLPDTFEVPDHLLQRPVPLSLPADTFPPFHIPDELLVRPVRYALPLQGELLANVHPAVADPSIYAEIMARNLTDLIGEITEREGTPVYVDAAGVIDESEIDTVVLDTITADAWVDVQEGWMERCNSGTGDTPWWSWRGIRTLTRKSGDYLSCFVQAIGEQKHTGADAVTTRFVVGRYWDLIEELSVSDLAAAYGDSDPDDDEDDFTVSDPHDEVPWGA